MGSGFKMTWKALVFIYGVTVAVMRASITMTKNVVLVSIIGLMAAAMRAGGIRASSTGSEPIWIQVKERSSMACGKMVNA